MASQKLQTNLSVAPYFDDMDPSKQFVRILFVPQVSIQTREVNQIQSLFQQQITRFADHVFKEGAVSEGVAVTYIPSQAFVHVADATSNGVFITEYANNEFVLASTSGVRAVPRKAIRGFSNQYPKTNRFYIDYISTGKDGSNNDVRTFVSGETISVYHNQSKFANLDSNNLVDTIPVLTANATVTTPIGTAYAVSTSEGVIYQKGHFLLATPQYTLVNELSTNVSNMTVGFTTNELIVTSDTDSSLLDNANGTDNKLGEGANRLKLVPTLIAVDKTTLSANTTFYPIVEFDNSVPVQENLSNDIYSALGEALSLKTKEESGDYTVSPFSVESLVTTNVSTMKYAVSSGIGVVSGHRVELIGTKTAEVKRGIDAIVYPSQIVTANYGNYVLVNEVVGLFGADALDTITIYDTAQATLTDVEGSGSAPSGAAIGTATVRAYVYDSGTKGKPSCQYRLYLANIKMNSGKSFANDAKSFYANGTYGLVKADLVLVSGKAVVQESDNDQLFFPFGAGAIKRLTDNVGTNRTSFTILDSATATLQANGFVTFTTNTPYAGGVERLTSSVGTISDVAELDYDITLSAEAYSTRTGTVTASSNVVVGTGTAFTTEYAVGDFIRIGTNVRRVTAIANTTQLSVNASVTATANVHQQYYPQGHIINLGGSGNLNILSNTQFSVNTNLGTLASGTQTVRAQFPVLRSTAVAAKKKINKGTVVKLDLSTAGTGGIYNLGLTDAVTIEAVYFGTTYSSSNPDRKDWFTLDYGQTAAEYGHSKLTVKPQYKGNLSSSTKLLVKVSHFTANTSAGVGFFSVDSYPIIREGDTANTTNIAISDIYKIGSYDFRDVIDCRPQRFNTATVTTVEASATVNPATANSSYQLASAGAMLVAPNKNLQADMEVYLPRYDLITLAKDGSVIVRQGQPAVSPHFPINESDTMDLATVYVPPFPTLTTREFEVNRRTDLGTVFNVISTRTYTMADIAKLDKRIGRLEYYATLNALEQSARDMTILDASGLDRFKNGIFADSFNTHLIGRTDHFEYKVAIDEELGIARPRFNKRTVDQMFLSSTSSNVQRTGNQISLPYNHAKFVSQELASKYRNCTESVWKWNGAVNLYPSYDSHRNEVTLPAINAIVDLTAGWDQFVNSPFGTNYGEWRTTSATSTSKNSTTTTTSSGRTVQDLVVGSTTTTQNLGSFVKDVSASPYIASRLVAFTGTGFKPNTKLYMYFDGVAVSSYCAPGVLSGLTTAVEGRENEVVNRTAAFGTTITSDASGNVVGVFKIPDNTFRTGDRVFKISDVSDLVTGASAELSTGTARYTASNLTVTTQGLNLTTEQPVLSTSTSIESRTQTTTIVTAFQRQEGSGGGGNGRSDPIAQSMLVTVPDTSGATGILCSQIGLFFKSKDPTLGVTVRLMEMTTGIPDNGKIVASKHLTSAEVSVSNDASVETLVAFDNLAYLARDKYYAFMVQPDGDSPEYTIWVAELGGKDIASGRQIFTNPYIGVMFISANSNTWTAIQTEDIKFNLYRAEFTALSGTASFVNEDDEYFTVDGFTKANNSLAIEPGDIVYTAVAGTPQTSNVSPIGYVQQVDEANNLLIVDSSNGLYAAGNAIQIHRKFQNNSNTINANTLIASATVQSIDNPVYSAVVPRFAITAPALTDVSVQYKGTDSTYTVDGAFNNVIRDRETEFTDKNRIIVSKSNEVINMGSNKSVKYNLNLTSGDNYMSPIIDLRKKTSLFIENIINNDVTNEHTLYGNASAKYVGPIVTLTEGQDAEDILVYVTAYRPSGSDITVYFKALNGTDASPFDDKVWTKLDYLTGSSLFSSSTSTDDYREFSFGLPASAPVATAAFKNASNGGVAEYVDANGVRFISFKSFSIKIVMTSGSSAIVPRCKDVRAIATLV